MGNQNQKSPTKIVENKKEDYIVINGEINGHLNKAAFRILFLQRHFSAKELCKLSKICKIWLNIIAENDFWREKFSKRYSIDCLDKRDWFDIEYETAKNYYKKDLDKITSYAPLWTTAFDYVEKLVPSEGGFDNLEKKWSIFTNNRTHFKQLEKMRRFIAEAKYNFPKLICTDFWDGTSVHIEECSVEWFKRMDDVKYESDKEDDNVPLEKRDKEDNEDIADNSPIKHKKQDITIFWQTAIMLEGHELAFYRIHVIADRDEMMHIYYVRYERSNHQLKMDNTHKKQFKDYKNQDLIDKFSSKDIYSIIKFLSPIVSQMRHLYISEKNLAQFSEAVVERSNKVLRKYYIKLQEQMYIKIECNLQITANKVLNNINISESNPHFIQFVNSVLADSSTSTVHTISSASLIACMKRIVGFLFIKDIRKKSFPTNEDLEGLLNYQIWDWASPKKPSSGYDLFTCYTLKFLFCNQKADPFERLHEVTKKWRSILSTASHSNHYPEIHHPWLQYTVLTAIPHIGELIENSYSSLVKLKLEEILSISCCKQLLRLGIYLGDLTELISYLPFYENFVPRRVSSPNKLKSFAPKDKKKSKSYSSFKSPNNSSSKLESEETNDLSLVESTDEVLINESDDKTTSWGSSFSSFLGFRKTPKVDNKSSVSEEDLKSKELELNLKEKELLEKEYMIEKKIQELRMLQSNLSNKENN